MNPSVPTVINPKTIEKQLKLYESRLQVLQDEVQGLERLRDACLLLLGTTSSTETQAVEAAESKARRNKKSEVPELVVRVQDVLREQGEGLTLDSIVTNLREQGSVEEDVESAVEATLKKHPELFMCAEGERWLPSELAIR